MNQVLLEPTNMTASYRALHHFRLASPKGRILTNSSGQCRQSGNPLLILEVIFFMFFLRDILHVLTVDATI